MSAKSMCAKMRPNSVAHLRTMTMGIWPLTSICGSILTSKGLLLGPAKDYPSALALMHVFILCLSQAVAACIRSPDNAVSTNIHKRKLGAFWFTALVMMVCVCIISGYKTLRFAGSLPTAVLLLSIRFDIIGSTVSSTSGLRAFATAISRMILFVTGFALVLLWDYRLNITSRDMAITFLVVSHIAPHTPTFAAWLRDSTHSPLFFNPACCSARLQHWPVCLLLPLAIVACLDEAAQPFIGIPSLSNGLLLLANLAFTAAACASLDIVALFDSLGDDGGGQPVPRAQNVKGIWLKLACTGLLSLGSLVLPASFAILSPWQFIGYTVAVFASCGQPSHPEVPVDDHTRAHLLLEEQDSSSKQADLLGGHSDTANRNGLPAWKRKSWSFSTIGLAIAVWLTFACIVSLRPTHRDQDVTIFDAQKLAAPVDLDIVISAYDRPGKEIAQDLNSLLGLPTLRNHTSRVYVYNKGLATSQLEKDILEHLSQHTALFVEELDNKGREGGTYLHHVESQWDNLASHTLFLQERPHDFTQMKQRIDDYLVPETGFMPLSYEGKVWKHCEHLHAGTWPGITDSISHISSMMNSSSACQDVVMTFRAQFLASRARIRSNDRAFYVQLLQDMQDRKSWMHMPKALRSPWVGAQSDSLVDPVFGYTLERLWGTIMRCSNSRIAERSPSLLGSYVRSVWFGQMVALEDVQCVDREAM